MKRLLFAPIAVMMASSAQAQLRVVGATEDMAALAREVGGDKVKVDAIARGYQDPHFVEAKPSFILILSKADLLVAVGRELEVSWLPLDSVRSAATGNDPAARICASIIWDFSNNDIPAEIFCGDFGAYDSDGGVPERSGFPYVVLRRDQDAPCSNLWMYDGPDAISGSGCIDPVQKRVEATVVAEVDGVRYRISARSPPTDLTP